MNGDSNIIFEKSKDNYLIARVKVNNKYKYIGSKYNMQSNIEKFMANIKGNHSDTIFIIFGLGTAEHIKAIRKKYIRNFIIVFEPNEELIKSISNNKELEWLEKDNKITIMLYESENYIKSMKSLVSSENVYKLKQYACFNYDLLYPNEYLDFFKKSKDSTIDKIRDVNTRVSFSEIWFENLIQNLDSIVKGEPVNSFSNAYKNKPAIVVSAGPSFDDNIEHLKNLDNEMLLLIGGRNLRAFSENNIEPHLVTIVDPLKISFELVEDYIGDCKAPLLFYEGSNGEAVKAHKGEKIFYTQSLIPSYIYDKEILNIGVGGSVAHIITQFAVIAGCNPIIFVGQDLAYKNEKMHAELTKTIGKSYHSDIDIITVEGYGGKSEVKTDISLERYKYELENIINDNKHITFINSSEGGARIKGTIEMNLKEAIDRYKSKVAKISIKSHFDRDKIKGNINDIISQSQKSAKNIINLSKDGLRKLADFRIAYLSNNISKYNKLASELDNIDDKINEIYEVSPMIEKILYPIILSLINQKNSFESDFDTKMEYINTVKERKHKFYSDVIERSQYVLDTINNIKE